MSHSCFIWSDIRLFWATTKTVHSITPVNNIFNTLFKFGHCLLGNGPLGMYVEVLVFLPCLIVCQELSWGRNLQQLWFMFEFSLRISWSSPISVMWEGERAEGICSVTLVMNEFTNTCRIFCCFVGCLVTLDTHNLESALKTCVQYHVQQKPDGFASSSSMHSGNLYAGMLLQCFCRNCNQNQRTFPAQH